MAKWGKCDIKQLKELRKRLYQFEEADKERICTDVAKNIAARLLKMAKKRTPEDTGALLASWDIENKPLTVVRKGNCFEITITNSMSYADYVEFGHRTRERKDGKRTWVEGKKMITVPEEELRKVAPKIIERRIRKELKRVFNGD